MKNPFKRKKKEPKVPDEPVKEVEMPEQPEPVKPPKPKPTKRALKRAAKKVAPTLKVTTTERELTSEEAYVEAIKTMKGLKGKVVKGAEKKKRSKPVSARAKITIPKHTAKIPQVELERTENGEVRIKAVQVKDIKPQSRVKSKTCAVILIALLILSSIGIMRFLTPPPVTHTSVYEEWQDLEHYYTVTAWVEDNMGTTLSSAMQFYAEFGAGNWTFIIDDTYDMDVTIHNFGKVPLGQWCGIRASVEWGTWSPSPASGNGLTFMVDSETAAWSGQVTFSMNYTLYVTLNQGR